MVGKTDESKKAQKKVKRFMITDEFRKSLLLEDVIRHRPEYDTFITIALSQNTKEFIKEIDGEYKEFIGIRAVMVLQNQKENATGKFNFSDFIGNTDYFDDDGNYNPGETFGDEKSGVNFEIIVNVHTFEGIEKSLYYFEPTDRLIRYLRLHRENGKWINPQTGDSIIEKEDKIEGSGHLKLLKIRKSELIDYLAARKCGLLLLRYAERMIVTPAELAGLPKPFEKKMMKNGRMDWIAESDPANPENNLYFSRLWDSFWIDPAKKPRRWDAQSHESRKSTVRFKLENGEDATYNQDGKERFFEVISFNLSLIKSLLSAPNNRIEFYSISTLGLSFSDGSTLNGCINKDGQFQTFFGDIVKNLDIEKQKYISGFSEPQKAKISREFHRTQIQGNFPETVPFKWSLSNCLNGINTLWTNRYGEALLLSPKENDFKDQLFIGPTSHNFDELLDIMLEIRKLIIPEYNINKIKNQLDYSSLVSNGDSYKNMKSLAFTRLFFKAKSVDKKEGESYILSLINDLRQCKGHPKDLDKVLYKHGIEKENPRRTFLFIMAEICDFLKAFKKLTESHFKAEVEIGKSGQNPWVQLDLAERYFKNPN